jgi:hypothetical protein
MSALSKVFVVVVFILSVAFFGTSATLFKTRLDWKKAYLDFEKGVKTELEQLKERNKSLVALTDNLQKTIDAERAAEAQLGVEIKRLTGDLAEEKKSVQIARSEASTTKVLMDQVSQTAEAVTKSNQALQEALDKAKGERETALAEAATSRQERDSMQLDLSKSQQELHALKVELKDLGEKFDTLAVVYERAKQVLPEALTPDTAPPIDGVVKAVDGEEKLVVLSVGRDDKVETGFDFTIYRGDEFLGKVKVIKVYPNLSGARILFTKDGATLQPGDKATTRIGLISRS